jgi:hypothetical protein
VLPIIRASAFPGRSCEAINPTPATPATLRKFLFFSSPSLSKTSTTVSVSRFFLDDENLSGENYFLNLFSGVDEKNPWT